MWAGRITALIGPNGSGKTTLLNVCSGFLKPDAGTMFLQGVDIGKYRHKRSELGMARTFQQPIVFGALNGAQNVMAGHSKNRPDPISVMLSPPSPTRRGRRRHSAPRRCSRRSVRATCSQKQASHATLAGQQWIIDLARALALDPTARRRSTSRPRGSISTRSWCWRRSSGAGRPSRAWPSSWSSTTSGSSPGSQTTSPCSTAGAIADSDPVSARNDPAVKAAYFGDVEMEEALVG